MKKKALVIHSGGLDSSLCLALAAKEFGKDEVLSLSFNYDQRHSPELLQAQEICDEWKIDHTVISIQCMKSITRSALIGSDIPIHHEKGESANTLVMGRNGLMTRLGAIHAQHLGARCIFLGVLEDDGEQMGYRDCTRHYFDLKQEILRLDLADPLFEIRTPLVALSKKETFELSNKLGLLKFLLDKTISCYEGIRYHGCRRCPSCQIRNTAIAEFMQEHPDFQLPESYLLCCR
jgi:7-cyano-7-deazaguanine synthase